MSVYSEEEPQFATLMAGYSTIKNGYPSWFFFSLLCAEVSTSTGSLCSWKNMFLKEYASPDDLVGYSFCWIIYPTRNAQREPCLARVCRGLEGACVDKQSFNSWWSGPSRGQWSPLLKPLVRHCLSSLTPCWLHKAKVLCDRLQTLLFCFVLSVFLLLTLASFFFHGAAEDFGGTWGGYDRILTSLLHSALRFGWHPALSAFSRAHSHLRHAQIPVSGARVHFA